MANEYIDRMSVDDTSSGAAVALFDLDGTISWRDTFSPFILKVLRRSPLKIVRFWALPASLVRYLFNRDRGLLKSRVIQMALRGETRARVEALAREFVDELQRGGAFRPAALAALERHRAARHHLVLLSASPNLYVPEIGRRLGFELTLCTEVAFEADRVDGRLLTENRRGAEKTRLLRELRLRFPGLPVTAYGNSDSDLPHLREAERALLVNGNARARREAEALNIPVDDWR